MPNIEQINLTPSQVDIRPSELGVEAAVQAGRRIGTFTHQLGETAGRNINIVGQAVVKHNEDVERQSLLESWTQGDIKDHEDFTSFMNLPENQGNPHASMEYYEQYSKPRYDALMAQAKTDGGKLFAQQLYDRSIRQSFDRSSTTQAAIAGQQHITAIEGRVGYYAAKVGNGEMSPDEAVAGLKSDMAGTAPSVGGRDEFANPAQASEEEGVYLREAEKTFAVRYFNGRLDRLEEGAAAGQDISAQKAALDADIRNGKYSDLLGTSATDLQAEADARIARGQEQASAAADRQHRADQWNGDATFKNFADELHMGPGGVVQVPADWQQRILADKTMRPEQKDSLFDMVKRMSAGDNASTPGLMNQLLGRALLSPTDPSHLTDKELWDLVDKPGSLHISKEDADFLYHRMHPTDSQGFAERQMLASGEDSVKAQLGLKDNLGIPPTPQQAQAFASFEQWFLPLYQAGLNAGTNPQVLLSADPAVKGALLTPANMAPFIKQAGMAPDSGPPGGPAPGAQIAPPMQPQKGSAFNWGSIDWNQVTQFGSHIFADITGTQEALPNGGVRVPIDQPKLQAVIGQAKAPGATGAPSQENVNGILFGGK